MNSLAHPILEPELCGPADDGRWVPDQSDGTFRNPVLFADYSDPDVIRHGQDFYLTASSFTCTPGLPILHSRDLVNWTILNHALKNLPHPRYDQVQPGCGVWAPSLRFHQDRFWIFFPTPDEGIYMTCAEDPAGRWSEPHLVQAGRGLIDPCPLWDEDGQAYLVHAYAGSRAGIKHRLRVCPMAPDGSRLLGEGQVVFHDPERHPTIEGPKFLKRNGWYYILAPAGGVAEGWQVVLRSRQIFGPYEDRIVLEQGSTNINGPHQGALVDAPDGRWWFLHFQDAGVYGRIVHVQPVAWREDWPLMGQDQDGNGIGEPVRRHAKPVIALPNEPTVPQTSDSFDSPMLGRQWQWSANHQNGWHSLTARAGWLRLFPVTVPAGHLEKAPNLLLQKLPARSFRVETRVELAATTPGEEAGLVVHGRQYAALALRRNGPAFQVVFRHDGRDLVVDEISSGSAELRLDFEPGGMCSFAYRVGREAFLPIPDRFQASPGVWIGAKVGIYALAAFGQGAQGYADFQHFTFSALASAD